ncbi:hypothetical protein F4811DRAFT_120652 [Daldinia bambusicola]|nr:hypothetical protein F4811DRAFT_120652 [Daldinia bambusicola]
MLLSLSYRSLVPALRSSPYSFSLPCGTPFTRGYSTILLLVMICRRWRVRYDKWTVRTGFGGIGQLVPLLCIDFMAFVKSGCFNRENCVPFALSATTLILLHDFLGFHPIQPERHESSSMAISWHIVFEMSLTLAIATASFFCNCFVS